jgi:hypothetical protein
MGAFRKIFVRRSESHDSGAMPLEWPLRYSCSPMLIVSIARFAPAALSTESVDSMTAVRGGG